MWLSLFIFQSRRVADGVLAKMQSWRERHIFGGNFTKRILPHLQVSVIPFRKADRLGQRGKIQPVPWIARRGKDCLVFTGFGHMSTNGENLSHQKTHFWRELYQTRSTTPTGKCDTIPESWEAGQLGKNVTSPLNCLPGQGLPGVYRLWAHVNKWWKLESPKFQPHFHLLESHLPPTTWIPCLSEVPKQS